MKKSKGVYIILLNTVLLLVIELVAHQKSNAVSVLGEAFHMAGDLLTLGVSLLASWLVVRYRPPGYPFGLARLEVVATAISLLLIWGPSVYLIKLAVTRYFYPAPVDRRILLITAGLSLIINMVNLTISVRMAKESSSDMSISSIYVHALSDLTQCLGLFFSAIALYIDSSLTLVDLLAACFSTTVCFCGSFGLAREVGRMLVDAPPVDPDKIKERLLKVDNVEYVYDVKIWDVGRRERVAMVQMHISENTYPREALHAAKNILHTDYAVTVSNVEIV